MIIFSIQSLHSHSRDYPWRWCSPCRTNSVSHRPAPIFVVAVTPSYPSCIESPKKKKRSDHNCGCTPPKRVPHRVRMIDVRGCGGAPALHTPNTCMYVCRDCVRIVPVCRCAQLGASCLIGGRRTHSQKHSDDLSPPCPHTQPAKIDPRQGLLLDIRVHICIYILLITSHLWSVKC